MGGSLPQFLTSKQPTLTQSLMRVVFRYTGTHIPEPLEVEVLSSAPPPTLQRGCIEVEGVQFVPSSPKCTCMGNTVMWAQAEAPADGTQRAAGEEAEQGEQEGPVVMGTGEKQCSRQGG